MSGGRRHWNDEAQRWEERRHTTATTAPVTPPPVRVTAGPAEPPGSEGPSRRALWSVVTGTAAAGVAVAVVLALTLGGGDEAHSPPGPARTTSPAPTPTPTETAPPDISDAPPPLPPEGYEKVVDREGFRIAVPQGWTRREEDSSYGMPVVDYCERDDCEHGDSGADDSHRLRIFEVEEETPKASFELLLSNKRFQPYGFEKLALENLNNGDSVSRLEYLYLADADDESGVVTRHAYDLRFVAPDDNIYAIAAYGPDDDGRDDELALLSHAAAWFCPPDTECPAPRLSPTA